MTGRQVGSSLALGFTLTYGVLMRWALAGVISPPLRFDYMRHAHSHTGWFALLVPLCWAIWSADGLRTPGRKVATLYALGAVFAAVGFSYAGYGIVAILGSTIVGGLWAVIGAWNGRRVVRPQDWHTTMPVAFIMAMICVPGIAIMLRRAPEVSQGLVETFLSTLLLGVALPTAARAMNLRAPPTPLWTLGTVSAALFLGIYPSLWTRWGLVLLGGIVLRAVWPAVMARPLKVVWLGLGASLLLLGVGVVPDVRPIAIAGMHFAILGPVLMALWPWPTGESVEALRGVYLVALSVMCVAIAAPVYVQGPWPLITAISGSVVALGWLVPAVVWWRR